MNPRRKLVFVRSFFHEVYLAGKRGDGEGEGEVEGKLLDSSFFWMREELLSCVDVSPSQSVLARERVRAQPKTSTTEHRRLLLVRARSVGRGSEAGPDGLCASLSPDRGLLGGHNQNHFNLRFRQTLEKLVQESGGKRN
jgi:hypothetical protein